MARFAVSVGSNLTTVSSDIFVKVWVFKTHASCTDHYLTSLSPATLEGPEALIGQMRYIISPVCSGSTLGPPTSLPC